MNFDKIKAHENLKEFLKMFIGLLVAIGIMCALSITGHCATPYDAVRSAGNYNSVTVTNPSSTVPTCVYPVDYISQTFGSVTYNYMTTYRIDFKPGYYMTFSKPVVVTADLNDGIKVCTLDGGTCVITGYANYVETGTLTFGGTHSQSIGGTTYTVSTWKSLYNVNNSTFSFLYTMDNYIASYPYVTINNKKWYYYSSVVGFIPTGDYLPIQYFTTPGGYFAPNEPYDTYEGYNAEDSTYNSLFSMKCHYILGTNNVMVACYLCPKEPLIASDCSVTIYGLQNNTRTTLQTSSIGNFWTDYIMTPFVVYAFCSTATADELQVAFTYTVDGSTHTQYAYLTLTSTPNFAPFTSSTCSRSRDYKVGTTTQYNTDESVTSISQITSSNSTVVYDTSDSSVVYSTSDIDNTTLNDFSDFDQTYYNTYYYQTTSDTETKMSTTDTSLSDVGTYISDLFDGFSLSSIFNFDLSGTASKLLKGFLSMIASICGVGGVMFVFNRLGGD